MSRRLRRPDCPETPARDAGPVGVSDDLVGLVVEAVRPARPNGHGSSWETLLGYEEQIRVAGTSRGGRFARDPGEYTPVRPVQLTLIPGGATEEGDTR